MNRFLFLVLLAIVHGSFIESVTSLCDVATKDEIQKIQSKFKETPIFTDFPCVVLDVLRSGASDSVNFSLNIEDLNPNQLKINHVVLIGKTFVRDYIMEDLIAGKVSELHLRIMNSIAVSEYFFDSIPKVSKVNESLKMILRIRVCRTVFDQKFVAFEKYSLAEYNEKTTLTIVKKSFLNLLQSGEIISQDDANELLKSVPLMFYLVSNYKSGEKVFSRDQNCNVGEGMFISKPMLDELKTFKSTPINYALIDSYHAVRDFVRKEMPLERQKLFLPNDYNPLYSEWYNQMSSETDDPSCYVAALKELIYMEQKEGCVSSILENCGQNCTNISELLPELNYLGISVLSVNGSTFLLKTEYDAFRTDIEMPEYFFKLLNHSDLFLESLISEMASKNEIYFGLNGNKIMRLNSARTILKKYAEKFVPFSQYGPMKDVSDWNIMSLINPDIVESIQPDMVISKDAQRLLIHSNLLVQYIKNKFFAKCSPESQIIFSPNGQIKSPKMLERVAIVEKKENEDMIQQKITAKVFVSLLDSKILLRNLFSKILKEGKVLNYKNLEVVFEIPNAIRIFKYVVQIKNYVLKTDSEFEPETVEELMECTLVRRKRLNKLI